MCRTACQKSLFFCSPACKYVHVHLPYSMFHPQQGPNRDSAWLKLKGNRHFNIVASRKLLLVFFGHFRACVKLETRRLYQIFSITFLIRSPQRNMFLRFWPVKLTAQASDKNKPLWVSFIKGPSNKYKPFTEKMILLPKRIGCKYFLWHNISGKKYEVCRLELLVV